MHTDLEVVCPVRDSPVLYVKTEGNPERTLPVCKPAHRMIHVPLFQDACNANQIKLSENYESETDPFTTSTTYSRDKSMIPREPSALLTTFPARDRYEPFQSCARSRVY